MGDVLGTYKYSNCELTNTKDRRILGTAVKTWQHSDWKVALPPFNPKATMFLLGYPEPTASYSSQPGYPETIKHGGIRIGRWHCHLSTRMPRCFCRGTRNQQHLILLNPVYGPNSKSLLDGTVIIVWITNGFCRTCPPFPLPASIQIWPSSSSFRLSYSIVSIAGTAPS